MMLRSIVAFTARCGLKGSLGGSSSMDPAHFGNPSKAAPAQKALLHGFSPDDVLPEPHDTEWEGRGASGARGSRVGSLLLRRP